MTMRCDQCQHWNVEVWIKDDDGGEPVEGICDRISLGDDYAWINAGDMAVLETANDFGCTLFEAKP